jgi:23S rRNA pseudouridine1911/1915/1917 synthase
MFGEKRKYPVGEKENDMRVDMALASLESAVSRQYIQKLIKAGRVFLGKRYLKPSYKVKSGDLLEVDFPKPVKLELVPANIPLEIVYEDEDLLVINKQAGLVVHPAEHGKFMGSSMVNAVLYHVGDGFKGIGGVLRPGIVHRLDKDTSGLIIVAKSDVTHQGLIKQFKDRTIKKSYKALLIGNLPQSQGRIEADIGRSTHDRKKMGVNGLNAKEAITEFKVLERFSSGLGDFTLVDVKLLTGRTHQIRVHFESMGFPLVGDKHYGKERVNKIIEQHFGLGRQFLNAYALSFEHPVSKKKLDLKVGLADDLEAVLKGLRKL